MVALTNQHQRTTFWQPLVLAAAILFLFQATLRKLAYDWWQDPNYSHGLLVPFIIGYILWTERESLARLTMRPQVIAGGALILAGVASLWVGAAGAELFVQRMSLVVLLAGIALYFFGWQMLRAMFVPLLLLILAIPIPTIVFNKIAFPLQLFASRCAVESMRAFDIPVLRDGNVIELMPLNALTPKKLEVVEACSGIRSLMTLVTLAVVFAYFTYNQGGSSGGKKSAGLTNDSAFDKSRRLSWFQDFRFWRAALIVLSAFPIAILTNALRVSGTGVLARYYGTEIADGFFHSFSGWVIYILAFLLLFAVGWTLDKAAALIRGKRNTTQLAPDDATVSTATAATETR